MAQGFEVTAGQLKKQRQELESLNSKFKTNIDKLNEYAQAVISSWEGEASSAFNKKFAVEKEKMTTLHSTVIEYVQAIDTIISNYSDAEKRNVELLGK